MHHNSNHSPVNGFSESSLASLRSVHSYIKQLITAVDQHLISLENFLEAQTHNFIKSSYQSTNNQHIKLTQMNPKQQFSHLSNSRFKTLIDHLIASVAQQACDQLKRIKQTIILHQFSTIKSVYLKCLKETSQLEEFYQNYWPELNSFKISSNQQYKPQNELSSQLTAQTITSVFQRFGVRQSSPANSMWISDRDFQKHSVNMHLIQNDRIETTEMKLMKQKQVRLIKQISLLRSQLLFNLSQQNANVKNMEENYHYYYRCGKVQLSQNQKLMQDLRRGYAELLRVDRHSVVVQVVAWPFLLQSISLQERKEQISTVVQQKILQFKLQAHGFSSNVKVGSSIKQRLKIDELCEIEPLKQFQSKLIRCVQQQANNEQDKYFQFGLISQEGEQLLKTFPFSSQQQLSFFQFSNQKPQLEQVGNRKLQDISKISIKIINLEGKYFIQSLNQAKIIPLNPSWEYFGTKITYYQQNDHANMKFYGLISNRNKIASKAKDKDKIKQESSQFVSNRKQITSVSQQYSEQVFLSIQLPPNMKEKVLKPFFLFKGFQGKITIKSKTQSTK